LITFVLGGSPGLFFFSLVRRACEPAYRVGEAQAKLSITAEEFVFSPLCFITTVVWKPEWLQYRFPSSFLSFLLVGRGAATKILRYGCLSLFPPEHSVGGKQTFRMR